MKIVVGLFILNPQLIAGGMPSPAHIINIEEAPQEKSGDPRVEVAYTINMGDRADEGWNHEVTKGFESILSSVEFVHSPTETPE